MYIIVKGGEKMSNLLAKLFGVNTEPERIPYEEGCQKYEPCTTTSGMYQQYRLLPTGKVVRSGCCTGK